MLMNRKAIRQITNAALQVEYLDRRFQAKDEAKTITGAEISIANIATSSICHTQHCILISNRSIVRVQMDKWCRYQLAAVEEVDQKKEATTTLPLLRIRAVSIQELRSFSWPRRKEEVQ